MDTSVVTVHSALILLLNAPSSYLADKKQLLYDIFVINPIITGAVFFIVNLIFLKP